jgi:FAD/FMN-containing dehydrogenase
MPRGIELTGRVLTPTDLEWDEARAGFAARFDYARSQPRAIVFCQSSNDVSNAVKWAQNHAVPLRVRCGRHNYQGYSSLVKDGLIVDVSELDHFSISADRAFASVGAGLNMITLTKRLGELGVCLPLATSPSVGLAGLIQGGGFGMTSRIHGLLCDNVTRFEVVDAKGDVLEVSDLSHPDLFWALRGGGGGNFGIVTAMTLTPHPINDVGVFQLTWRWEDFERVVDKWQRWNFEADRSLTSLLSLCVGGVVALRGQWTPQGNEAPDAITALSHMLTDPEPIDAQRAEVPFLLAALISFDVNLGLSGKAEGIREKRQFFKSSSALALDFIPHEGISEMKRCLEQIPALHSAPSQPSMIQLLGGGGKAADPLPDATAVYYRKAKVIVQYDGYWTAPEDAQPTIEWVAETRDTMLLYTTGAYVNYHDDQLGDDWLEQYYGGNVPRLRRVKSIYDPDNLFNFPQSVPPG